MKFLYLLTFIVTLLIVTLHMAAITNRNTQTQFKCEYEIEIVNDSIIRIKNTQTNNIDTTRIDNFEEYLLTDNQ